LKALGFQFVQRKIGKKGLEKIFKGGKMPVLKFVGE
jgi:hypothetical protein